MGVDFGTLGEAHALFCLQIKLKSTEERFIEGERYYEQRTINKYWSGGTESQGS